MFREVRTSFKSKEIRKTCFRLEKTTQQTAILPQNMPGPAGNPPDSVLSPTPFCLFTADLSERSPNRNPIKIIQYADDLILYTSNTNISLRQLRLNSHLEESYRYFTRRRLSLKPRMCETIFFPGNMRMTAKMRRDTVILSLKVLGMSIPNLNEIASG